MVGGGLAGIAAALSCADAGAEVTLVEVRPRLGGAAYSFERDGMVLDNGQHVFLRCCTAYRALLDRLGTASATTLQPRLEIPVIAPGGRVEWLRRSSLPAPLHLTGSLARYGHLSLRERASAARAALELSRLDLADGALDSRTFGDWLADHGQSPNAFDALWNLIALPTLNLDAGEASLAMAAFVFQTGLLNDSAAGDVGYARLPLSAIHGEPSARALRSAGVDVRTGGAPIGSRRRGPMNSRCRARTRQWSPMAWWSLSLTPEPPACSRTAPSKTRRASSGSGLRRS